MKNLIFFLICLLSQRMVAQVVVEPEATLRIGQGATISVEGGVANRGSLQNLGLITFTGDWTNTNLYNDAGTGQIEANGPSSQSISNSDQSVGILNVNSGTEVTILGNTFEILNELTLTNGIVRLGDGTSLVINENATITGGSSSAFIEGTIIQKGGGVRFYPLGIQDFYMPLTLLDVANNGTGLEMSVRIGLFSDTGAVPQPVGSVIGVSDYHYWEINEISGEFFESNNGRGSIAQATFDNVDLDTTNFGIVNRFNFAASTVGLVQSSALDGEFSVIESDNSNFEVEGLATATAGIIDTVDPINKMFVGVGLVAATDPAGVMYVPTAFSPSAFNTDDQRFRVFGDRIVDEPFSLKVFNSFGVEVYSTDRFMTATNEGWDGINQTTNNEEPIGSYRYFIQYTNTEEKSFKENGVVLLIR